VGWIRCGDGSESAGIHACAQPGRTSCPSADDCVKNEREQPYIAPSDSHPVRGVYLIGDSLCVARDISVPDETKIRAARVSGSPPQCPNLLATNPASDACVTPRPVAKLEEYPAPAIEDPKVLRAKRMAQ
jgi:hypothetical protein